MSDAAQGRYRIVGLAGRGALAQGTRPQPFLVDLGLVLDPGADDLDVLRQAALAAAEALEGTHATLAERAHAVAQAVLSAGGVLDVDLALQQPEALLGVPVLEVGYALQASLRSPEAGPDGGAGSEDAVIVPALAYAESQDAAAADSAALGSEGAVAGPAAAGLPSPTAGGAHPSGAPGDADVSEPAERQASGEPATDVEPEAEPDSRSGRGTLSSAASAERAGGADWVPTPTPAAVPMPQWHPVAGGAVPGSRAQGEGAAGSLEVASLAQPAADAEPDLELAPEPGEAHELAALQAQVEENLDTHVSAVSVAAEPDGAAEPDVGDGASDAPGDEVDHDSDLDHDSGDDAAASEVSEDDGDADDRDADGGEADDLEVDASGEPHPSSDDPDEHQAQAAAVPDAAAATGGPMGLPAAQVPDRKRHPARALVSLEAGGENARQYLAGAVAALGRRSGIDLEGVSPLARTSGPDGEFESAVVRIESYRAIGELADELADVAAAVPGGVVIEIVTVDGLSGEHDGVEIPGRFAHERAAILVPWAQLEPGAELPGLGGGAVVSLAETAPDRESVRWLALDWWGDTD